MTLGSAVGVNHPQERENPGSSTWLTWGFVCALGGIRTPNLLIRSQMLYPLSYERWTTSSNDTWGRWVEANRLRERDSPASGGAKLGESGRSAKILLD